MDNDLVAVARACYRPYADKDRAAIEALIADNFHFTSPLGDRSGVGHWISMSSPSRRAVAFAYAFATFFRSRLPLIASRANRSARGLAV
jgi:hypothetical protein